jgi:hypothetical protein
LRRELAKIFVKDYKLKQKEIAKLLGITEASVSNYIKSKRGEKIKFSALELKKIKESAGSIVNSGSSVVKELYGLCNSFKESKGICKIHRSVDKTIEKGCDVCY